MDSEKLANSIVRHDLASAALDKGEADKYVRLLNAAIDDAKKDLAGRTALAISKGKDKGPARTQLLNDIIESYSAINEQVYEKIGAGLEGGLIDRARHEGEFTVKAGAAAGARVSNDYRPPDFNYLKTLVNNTPIPVDQHGAALLKPWVKGMEEGDLRRFEGALRTGLALGETTDQLVKRIEAGGWAKSRQSAQTVAITANSAIANAARVDTFKAMPGIRFVEWSSILDNRTSPICQDRSGNIYPIDSDHPVPPAHPRCRSLLLPRKNDTDPPLHKPYHEWLKGQSKDVQDEVMGKAKGDLYRSGKITKEDLYRQDGSFKTLDQLKKTDAKIVAPTPEPAPVVVKPPFTTPINPSVTAETIKVLPRKDIVQRMNIRLSQAAADPRYEATPEFKGIKAEMFGKAALPTSFSDEASSVILELMSELDTLSDAFDIPRLRAIRPVTGPIANMGDGTLGMNAVYFNSYATTVGKAGGATAAAEAKVAKIAAEMEPLRAKLAELKIAFDKAKAAGDQNAYYEIYAEQQPIAKQYHKLSKAHFTARSKVRTAERVSTSEISTWKPGDDIKTRPYNTTDYFTGIDKARNVLFHEFGHHVHQMLGKTGRRRTAGTPPLEKKLGQMFNAKFHRLGIGREEKLKVTSTYATTNQYEWWAESFALYMMDRKDLVDPDLLKLIEELLNG